jgi:hypothetical protein
LPQQGQIALPSADSGASSVSTVVANTDKGVRPARFEGMGRQLSLTYLSAGE